MSGVQKVIVVAVVAVCRKSGDGWEVLIARRKPGVHLAGLWELPGGKVEPGESAESAARREAFEEVGVDLPSLTRLIDVRHDYGDREVEIHAFVAQVDRSTDAKPLQVAECRWVTPEAMSEFEWPAANAPIIEALRRALIVSDRSLSNSRSRP